MPSSRWAVGSNGDRMESSMQKEQKRRAECSNIPRIFFTSLGGQIENAFPLNKRREVVESAIALEIDSGTLSRGTVPPALQYAPGYYDTEWKACRQAKRR